MKKSDFKKFFAEKDKEIMELSPLIEHECPQLNETFYFVRKTLAHEEIVERRCKQYLKKISSNRAPTFNEIQVTLYMVLLCDKDGERLYDTSNKDFFKERKELMSSPAFNLHINAALIAIGESPLKPTGAEDSEEDDDSVDNKKKPSSKTTKDA